MNSRVLLEQHLQTLDALLRGPGIVRGVGTQVREGEDDVQSSLRNHWVAQQNILRRVLHERGDPAEQLHEWRERTRSFMDKYPERKGWTDRDGVSWNAQDALEAIDKLLEEIEAWEGSDEAFEEMDEEEEW
jgi:hypothetical protein